MKAEDCDVTWVQTQLTLARWHLHAATSSVAGAVRQRLQQAREVYEMTASTVSRLQLNEEQRTSIEQELATLRFCLESSKDQA